MDFQTIVGSKLNVLKPGCGWLPDDWMPHENIRKALRRFLKQIAKFYQITQPRLDF
jgi:hypothetical protein